MVAYHGGMRDWRVYRELRIKHELAREAAEGMKWLRRSKSAAERADVWSKYGAAMSRYYGVCKVGT